MICGLFARLIQAFLGRAESRPSETSPQYPLHAVVTIPGHLEPLDRGEWFEDPVADALEERDLGGPGGGGTQLTEDGRIESAEIEFDLSDDPEAIKLLETMLVELGAPMHTRVTVYRGDQVTHESRIGVHQRVEVFLNASTLPEEVYKDLDFDALWEDATNAIQAIGGRLTGSWTSENETCLYFLGPSEAQVVQVVRELAERHPIFSGARVVSHNGTEFERTTEQKLPSIV